MRNDLRIRRKNPVKTRKQNGKKNKRLDTSSDKGNCTRDDFDMVKKRKP